MSAIDSTAKVHPTADLEADVTIGAGTSVGQRAQIRKGATIGAECVIERDAFIDEGVVLGDRVEVLNAALVYHGVTADDGVFIGPNAVLTNDRYPRSIRADGQRARGDDRAVTPIHLHPGASIGAGAVVVAGNDVGRFAMVGAGAVVTRSVPDHALVAGDPARRIGWVCVCGRRLVDADGVAVPARHAGSGDCPGCGTRYRIAGDRCIAVGEEALA